MAKSTVKSSRSAVKVKRSAQDISLNVFLMLLGAWAVVWVALLSLPNFLIMIPGLKSSPLYPGFVIPTLLAGFAALVYMWKQVPETDLSRNDISPWLARFLFWFFIVLGGYLRLFDIFHVGSSVWADHYVHTSDIRSLVDFQWRPLLFPQGQREPLFPYFTAMLWHFWPTMTGLGIMQISNALIDLSALWVFYLLGKEVGGRRMGLLLMGIGTISKLMIETTKDQVGADTCVVGGVVALLFTFRFLKKTDMKHAIEWGIALGFGAYTYVPMRPWMPAILGLVWLWILSDKKEKHFEPYRLILGPGVLLSWAFLFIYKNGFIDSDHVWVRVLAHPVVGAVCILIAIYGYYEGYRVEHKKGFSKLYKWAVAAAVIRLILLPLYQSPDYANHVAAISVISSLFYSSANQSLNSLLMNLRDLLPLFFGPRGFPMCFPSSGDSMYCFFETSLAVLGLSYFIARPSLEKIYVIILFFVGWVPGVLSNAPYPLRYLTSDVTLFLAGAWGLNRLWVAAFQVKDTKKVNALVAVIVLACGVWQLSVNFNLYQKWMALPGPNPLLDNLVQEELPTHRVYLVYYYNDSFWTICQDLLCDQRQVYRALQDETNEIDLPEGEKGKDLAVFVYAKDAKMQQVMEKEFPGIPWKKTKIYFSNPQGEDFAYCMEIPFEKIPRDPKAFFHVRYVAPTTWLRRYYGSFGLARGFIRYEDRVTRWNEPVMFKENDVTNGSQRITGDIQIPADGNYVFTLSTSNVYQFYLDGKKIFDVQRYDRHPGGRATVHLSAGPHQVEVTNACTVNQGIAPIMIQGPGMSQAVSLEDFVLNTVPVETTSVSAKK